MVQLHIEPVTSQADLWAFLILPWEVYRHDRYWVPPLLSEQRTFFDRHKNPFFRHGRAEYFLARRTDQVVGRIAVLVNELHNDFHDEQVGFFGAFEVVEDAEVALALLESASDWVRAAGMTAIRGPATFSSNDEFGLLVDGFETSPVLLTTYNPPRYMTYLEQAGFKKVMDMYGYHLERDQVLPQTLPRKLVRIAERLKQHPDVSLRTINMQRFQEETNHIWRIYNAAWAKNWGFVPLTELEFKEIAYKLKQIADPDLVFFVELKSQVVGFSVALPDLNQALRLAYPNPQTPEWISTAKLLWHWKVRPKITTLRMFALGVQEEARRLGLDALLYYETARVALAKGYRHGEMSWLLETNTLINPIAKIVGAEIYKTWRIYERNLTEQL